MSRKIMGIFLAVLSFCLIALGEDVERVSVQVNQMIVLDVGFPFKSQDIQVTDKSVVSVTMDRDRQDRMCVTGLALGKAEIRIASGGAICHYSVIVEDSLHGLLKSLRRDLESVSELDIEINRDLKKIRISGDVFSLDGWETLQSVLPHYEENVINLARFRPTPEVMQRLQDKLEAGGYKVVKDNKNLQPGELFLRQDKAVLYLNGTVFCGRELEDIKQIIGTESWISQNKQESAPVRLMNKIVVKSTLLKVGFVFVGVTDNESSELGGNLLENGISVGASYNYANKNDQNNGGNKGSCYNINADLSTVLNILAETGCSRYQHGGFMNFTSDESDVERSFHVGGTIKVRINSDNGTGSLQDIDYGINVSAKGGLIGQKRVKLTLDMSLTTPNQLDNGDYDVQGQDIKQIPIECDLGETIALAGLDSMTEGVSNSGVPYLRKVPALKWLFSSDGERKVNMRLMMFVYPEVAGVTPPYTKLPKVDEAKLMDDVNEDSKERQEKSKESEPWYKRWF